jgi:hypothetical protein
VDGYIQVGMRLGDYHVSSGGLANANHIDHFTEYLDSTLPVAIELNGFGSSIVHPVIVAGTIRFFDQAVGNSIIGGHFEAANVTNITIDALAGQRNVVTVLGTNGCFVTKIVDNIEPTVNERYTLLSGAGGFSLLSQILSKAGTIIMALDAVGRRLIIGGSEGVGGTTPFYVQTGMGYYDGNISTGTPYNVGIGDVFLMFNPTTGNQIVNLPIVGAGPRLLILKKIDAGGNTVTITSNTGPPDLIDNAATYVLSAAYQSVTLHTDGNKGWRIIGKSS